MGSVFKKPKPAPKPKVEAPAPLPETPVEAEESAIKKARRASSYQKTILTGALSPKTGRKTTLG